MLQRIGFGIALPVVFISGSINGCVVARYIHGRIFENSRHKYINTPLGWAVWIALLLSMSIIAFIIAEAIPFFSDLLSLISALFISGFSFYLPGIFWYCMIREGPAFSRKNIVQALLSLGTVIFGLVVLVAGLYSAAESIKEEYTGGGVRAPFSCPVIEE